MNTQCRLCLRQSSGRVPLFEARIGENLLTEIIFSTFQVELDKSANFPRNICEGCFKKVDFLYNFHRDVVKCQSLLTQWSKGGKAPELSAVEEERNASNDEIFEQLERLAEEISEDYPPTEIEALEQEEEEEESVDQHAEEEPNNQQDEEETVNNQEEGELEESVQEQLIDIKIEAIESDNELIVEQLSEESEGEYVKEQVSDIEEEEEFNGFQEPVPVKLVSTVDIQNQRQRKAKQTVPKLEIVETIPNKCYVCDTTLENKDLFDVHLVTHTDMLPYKCLLCSIECAPIEIKTLVLLNKHFESHGFSYLCSQCPLRFRSYAPLYDHTRNAHNDRKEGFHCEVCGQRFDEIRKFQKHVRAHKNRDAQRYKCKTCEKTFQTGTILRRHERIHATEYAYVCPFCDRGFNHDSNYQQHKMRHIQQQCKDQQGYPCTVCDTHHTNATDLRIHMRKHFPDDPIYNVKSDILPVSLKNMNSYPRCCEEPDCKYIAPSYQLMWSHYRNHYKMYECPECDRKFATATILKTHIEVIHMKLRKWECEICQKTYAYQHKFKEHMNMHKGIKTRQCRYCDKTFTHSSNLLVHERIHTKVRPYTCEVCGSTHVTTSALKKHQKTHQKNKIVVEVAEKKSEEVGDEIFYVLEEEIC